MPSGRIFIAGPICRVFLVARICYQLLNGASERDGHPRFVRATKTFLSISVAVPR